MDRRHDYSGIGLRLHLERCRRAHGAAGTEGAEGAEGAEAVDPLLDYLRPPLVLTDYVDYRKAGYSDWVGNDGIQLQADGWSAAQRLRHAMERARRTGDDLAGGASPQRHPASILGQPPITKGSVIWNCHPLLDAPVVDPSCVNGLWHGH